MFIQVKFDSKPLVPHNAYVYSNTFVYPTVNVEGMTERRHDCREIQISLTAMSCSSDCQVPNLPNRTKNGLAVTSKHFECIIDQPCTYTILLVIPTNSSLQTSHVSAETFVDLNVFILSTYNQRATEREALSANIAIK